MRKILLLIFTVSCFTASAQFPTKDSALHFLDRYIRNSSIQAFTNNRLNTLLHWTINNSGEGGGGGGSTDTSSLSMRINLKADKATTISIVQHYPNANTTTRSLSANGSFDIAAFDTAYAYAAIGAKVDKIVGKGLSTEDYTTTEKNKLGGIAAGATNVTNTNQLTNGAAFLVAADITNKVDKITGKGLSTEDYTTAEKSKLAGIAAGATNVTNTNQLTNGSGFIAQSALNDTAASIRGAIAAGGLSVDANPTDGSTNPVASNGVYDALVAKLNISDTSSMLSDYRTSLNTKTTKSYVDGQNNLDVKYTDSATMLAAYQTALNNRTTKTYVDNADALNIKYTDSSTMLSAYRSALLARVRYVDTTTILSAYQAAINARPLNTAVIKYTDSSAMLGAYQTALNARIKYSDSTSLLAAYQTALNARPLGPAVVKYNDTTTMLGAYQSGLNARVKYTDTTSILSTYQTALQLRVKYTDTSGMLTPYQTALLARIRWTDTATLFSDYRTALLARLKYSDTSTILAAYATALNARQPVDADLTTIAGLAATTDNFLVGVSSAWASRTPAQVKTTLVINNVDNTSDATKNSATATLTNKRVNPRIGTTASSATPAPDGDNNDQFNVTALAAGATFAAPTGTPVDGQALLIRIKDNGTARTLAWNAIYRASTDFALPTTTVISKTMYVQFVYNGADAKWDCTGLTQGF